MIDSVDGNGTVAPAPTAAAAAATTAMTLAGAGGGAGGGGGGGASGGLAGTASLVADESSAGDEMFVHAVEAYHKNRY